MVRSLGPHERLALQLMNDTPKDNRCPHLREDGQGPYCGNNHTSGNVEDIRRTVCDTASLQLWCLEATYAPKCTYYKNGPLSQ